MSHTASVMVEFTRTEVLKDTCDRLNLQLVEQKQTIQFYDGVKHEVDRTIQLPGWKYPLGIKDNQAVFDNYNGSWGKMSELTKLQNEYSRDLMNVIASEQGMMVEEEEYDEVTGEAVIYMSAYE